MDKCLFMVCPTDHLEPAIDHWFEGFKYYYSSLGNTFSLDEKTLGHISDLIEKNGIGQIMVILSENNRIVLDALNKRQYVEITGLAEPYGHLIDHKKHVVNTWQAPNQSQLVLSRHLNQKIAELSDSLKGHLTAQPHISGKLYSKKEKIFKDIHSRLVCADSIHLN